MPKEFRSPSSPLYTLNVLLLALIIGVSYLGFGFILPLLTLYGKQIGATSVEIGLMASSFLLAGFLATPFVGWLADRFHYRKVLLISLFLHAVLFLMYIPIHNPVFLILLRSLEGITTVCIITTARSCMNTIAPKARQGEALGILSASQTVGTLIGPAVGALLASLTGYTFSFLLASILLSVAAGGTALFLKASQIEQNNVMLDSKSSAKFANNLFTRPLILTYLLQFILLITNGVAAAVWSLYMWERGASLPLIGLSFTTFAMPIILIAPLAGRFSDRYGRSQILLLGLILSGVVFCLYSLKLSPWWIIGLSLFEGASIAIARASVDGLLADAMPSEMKGKIQANYNAAGTLGSFIGSLGAGILYSFSPGIPFLVEGLLYLSTFVILLFPGVWSLFSIQSKGSERPDNMV